MIVWISALFTGPLLAGFAVYLCRGPGRDRRLAREQIAEWQILAEIERLENLRRYRHQRNVSPARLFSVPRVRGYR